MAGAATPTPPPEPRCRRCECAIEPGDLRCAICGLLVPDAERTVDSPMAAILRCGTCGAAVAYDVEVQAPRCPFCDSRAAVERPTDPIERPRWFLPFHVSPEQAQAALGRWLATRGFFRPADLAARATLEAIRPLWWVAWVFDARALVSWTADSDAGRRHADWAPWAGQTSLGFDRVLVPASRGLTAGECAALADRYDLQTAAGSPAGPAGAFCEGFDVQRSAARATIARAVEQVAFARSSSFLPGSRHRNVRLAVLLESLRTQRVALPAFVLAYRYRGQPYRAVVHGQDPSRVIGGAPWSIARIALVTAAALLALLLALLAVVGPALLGSG